MRWNRIVKPPVDDQRVRRLGTARHGVWPTWVTPASIDRWEWHQGQALRRALRQAGAVASEPVARSRSMQVHSAVDRHGMPAWLLRGDPAALASREQGIAALGSLETGFRVPPVTGWNDEGLWLGRESWSEPDVAPTAGALERYVVSAVSSALCDGTIVATGDAHVTADGGVVCEDTFVARRLEPDERAHLHEVWSTLVTLDAVGAADASSRVCGARTEGLPAAARRAVIALAAEWTPVSLALSLHELAFAIVPAGPRSEPLVLLADELLHRLDLAHAYGGAVPTLASPTTAIGVGRPCEAR